MFRSLERKLPRPARTSTTASIWNRLIGISGEIIQSGRLKRCLSGAWFPLATSLAGLGAQNGQSRPHLAPSLSKRRLDTLVRDNEADSVRIEHNGSSVWISYHESQSRFHAHWLWCNDPTFIHATSGQRTRSTSSFSGWKIVRAELTGHLDGSLESPYIVPYPPPVAGCLHPVGTVYRGDTGDTSALPYQRQYLCITWERSGELLKSFYDMGWLWSCRYDNDALNDRKRQSTVDRHIALGSDSTLETVEYADLCTIETRDTTRYHLLHHVIENGAVMIKNAWAEPGEPTVSVVSAVGMMLAGSLSHSFLYGDTFQVQALAEAHNIAYTSTPLPPHQDLSYYESKPGLQLLHCVANSGVIGGESTLIDGMAAASEFRRLAPGLFELLVAYEATFVKQRQLADMVYRRPHVEVDSVGAVVGVHWSPPFEGPAFVPSDVMEAFLLAETAFERMVDNSLPKDRFMHDLAAELEDMLVQYAAAFTWECRLEPGHILVFNNQRMLHGRRGFYTVSGKGERHLIGCYTNMEETVCQYRLLRRERLGLEVQASLAYHRNLGNGSSGA